MGGRCTAHLTLLHSLVQGLRDDSGCCVYRNLHKNNTPPVTAFFKLEFLGTYGARDAESCVVRNISSRSVDTSALPSASGLLLSRKPTLKKIITWGEW